MRNEKRDFLKDMSFSGKMLVIYIICIIIPIITVSIFYKFITTSKINSINAKEINNSVLNAKSSVQSIIDRALLLSDLIYYDDDIYENLYLNEESGKSLLRSAGELDERILSYVIADTLEGIEIYSSNDYLYRSTTLKKMSDAKGTKWLDDFIAADKNINVLAYYDETLHRYKISMLRKLNKKKYNDSSNILKLDLSVADISQALYMHSEKSNVYLLNGDTVIAARKYRANLAELEYNVGNKINEKDGRIVFKDLDYPAEFKVAVFYNPKNMPDMFGAEIITFIAIIFIILFVSSLVILMITNSHATKLNSLTECALKIQKGIFETVDDKNMGKDEVGTLTRGINDAIVKINSLINEVYKEKIRNTEIEKAHYKTKLNALQGQVNPHFMFNIFEVMRMKALKKQDKELAMILKKISKMFRHLISWKEDMITLDEEMVFVNAFIDVQSYSMDDEVSISINVDEEAKQCYIPKMSVQIFVENAFLHGLESIVNNKTFSLSAHIFDDRLIIEICDNGEGFKKELVEAINSGNIESYTENKGVGIKNVITRLKLYFDNEFTIYVSSVPYEKTQIKLDLPVKNQ